MYRKVVQSEKAGKDRNKGMIKRKHEQGDINRSKYITKYKIINKRKITFTY